MATELKRILTRRGTAAQWAAANPVLASGELGYEIDTKFLRMGDGTSDFPDLPIINDQRQFASVAAFNAAATAGYTAPDGTVVWVGNFAVSSPVGFVADSASSGVDRIPDGWRPYGRVSLAHFDPVRYTSVGAATTGTDSSAAAQAALDYMNNNLGGPVYVHNGRYRLNNPLLVSGFYSGFEGEGKNAALFVVTHTLGEGIRWVNDGPVWRDIGMVSGGARSLLSYDITMPGLRVELPDAPFASTTRTRLIDFNGAVNSQPGSGCIVVGPATGQFINGQYSNNKGHGIHFAEEIITRTNFADVPGLCTIETNQFFANGGHAIYSEGPNEFSSPSVRIDVKNNEIGENATNAAVRSWHSEIYLRGAQFDVRLNVFKPAVGNTTIEAWCVSGVGIVIENNRYIRCARAGTITSHATLPTKVVRVSGMHMIEGPAPYDPVVLVRKETGAPAPQGVQVNGVSGGVVTRLVGTDSTIGVGGPERVLGHTQSMPSMLSLKTNATATDTTASVDLTDISPRLAPNETVYFEWTCAYTSEAAADIRLLVAGPAGSTFEYGTPDSSKAGTADTYTIQSNQTSSAAIVFGGGGALSRRTVTLTGYCTNGATEGPLLMRFSQAVADPSTTTVYAGLTNVKIWRPMQ